MRDGCRFSFPLNTTRIESNDVCCLSIGTLSGMESAPVAFQEISRLHTPREREAEIELESESLALEKALLQ